MSTDDLSTDIRICLLECFASLLSLFLTWPVTFFTAGCSSVQNQHVDQDTHPVYAAIDTQTEATKDCEDLNKN